MRILKFLGKLILLLIAIIVNTVEGACLGITYTLWFVGFIFHVVFKKLSEWIVILTKAFNFVNIFRRYEE